MATSKSAKEAWGRRRIGAVPTAETFIEKVHKHACGCWMWKGAFFARGYGSFNVIESGKHKAVKANRQSYRYFKGDIPAGMLVLHTCDNKGCVNPDHLYLGTHAQNMEDAKVRRQIHYGERHAHFIRTDGLVDRVNDLYTSGETVEAISRWLMVSRQTCQRALGKDCG